MQIVLLQQQDALGQYMCAVPECKLWDHSNGCSRRLHVDAVAVVESFMMACCTCAAGTHKLREAHVTSHIHAQKLQGTRVTITVRDSVTAEDQSHTMLSE